MTRRALLALALLGACGAPAAPAAPLGNAAAPVVSARDVEAIDVTTLRTSDDVRKVPRRAYLRADAQLRWREAAAGTGAGIVGDAAAMTRTAWPVLAVTATDVRIAIDRDVAVIAVWLARDGVVPTIVDEVTPTRGGVALPVTLRPGAAVAVAPGGTTIALVHHAIELRADVPTATIGDIFMPPPPPVVAEAPTGQIAPGTDVRASADPAAAPFAQLRGAVVVALGEVHGALRAFTYVDDVVVLRGYVPVAATSASTSQAGYGTSPPHEPGYPQHLVVPAGACLLSSDGVEVVGITNRASEVRVQAGAEARYWELQLMVPWGYAHPLLEDEAATGDVVTAQLRRCTR